MVMAPAKRNAEQVLPSSPPSKKKKEAPETAAASRPRRTKTNTLEKGEPGPSISKAVTKSKSATRKSRTTTDKTSETTQTTAKFTKPTKLRKSTKTSINTGDGTKATTTSTISTSSTSTKNTNASKSTESAKTGIGKTSSVELLRSTNVSIEIPITNRLASEAKKDDEGEGDVGRCHWLMKAEPESRMEKGVDVKFSIDDLAAKEEPEAWDGKALVHLI